MYLHRRNVVHRDLKLDNIMLKEEKTGKWIVKLGDFGQAKKIRHREQIMRGFCGNQSTITPEMLTLRRVRKIGDQRPSGYNYKIDTWAIGAVFY